MTISLKVNVLPEPYLEFGDGNRYHEPKVGLTKSGPLSLRYGNDIPGSVRLGFIGTPELLDAGHQWFERCQHGILASKENRRRHPDFPPFAEVFRTELLIEDRWVVELTQRELGAILTKPLHLQFQSLVDLYDDAVRQLSERELGPNVIICSLPNDLLSKFHTWHTGNSGRRRTRRASPPRNQLALFDDQTASTEDANNAAIARDFRRSLKARAMNHNARIQLAHNRLFLDAQGGDDPATKAWDVCTACFYKAGGIPWRLADASPYTCFVGISFHHLRTEKNHVVYSSCAEAFSTETEGFVLRGDNIDWSAETRRTPHLDETQAFNLAKQVSTEYRNRTGRNPIRAVLHKTSAFQEPERAGFTAGWSDVPQIEFITLYPSNLNLLPRGDYPPRRGTIADINGSKHLYTTGFYEPWGSYPGPHVPRPIDVRHQSDPSQIERSCREILSLTKMNFNSAAPFGWMPITTKMAGEVGRIVGEVEPGRTPETSYRAYM